MDWGAIASTAVDIAGKWWQANEASQEAEKNRDFQRDLSDTAYQRAVTDLRKAGINPMLAAKVGGASTPSGATAATPDTGNIGSSAYNNYMRGLEREKAQAEVDNTKATTANTAANTQKTLAETNNVEKAGRLLDVQAEQGLASARQSEAATRVQERLFDKVEQETANLKTEGDRIKVGLNLLLKDLDNYDLKVKEKQAIIANWLIQNKLQGLKEPEARAAAKAAESYWGQEVAPYDGWLGKLFSGGKQVYDFVTTPSGGVPGRLPGERVHRFEERIGRSNGGR